MDSIQKYTTHTHTYSWLSDIGREKLNRNDGFCGFWIRGHTAWFSMSILYHNPPFPMSTVCAQKFWIGPPPIEGLDATCVSRTSVMIDLIEINIYMWCIQINFIFSSARLLFVNEQTNGK